MSMPTMLTDPSKHPLSLASIVMGTLVAALLLFGGYMYYMNGPEAVGLPPRDDSKSTATASGSNTMQDYSQGVDLPGVTSGSRGAFQRTPGTGNAEKQTSINGGPVGAGQASAGTTSSLGDADAARRQASKAEGVRFDAQT